MAKRELPMEPEPTAPCVTHPHCGLTEAEVEAAAREMARLVGEDPDSTDEGFMAGKYPLWKAYVAIVRQHAALAMAIHRATADRRKKQALSVLRVQVSAATREGCTQETETPVPLGAADLGVTP